MEPDFGGIDPDAYRVTRYHLARALVAACGGPFLTKNEARVAMGLVPVDVPGYDEYDHD
jgi:hypothetical protein